MNCFIRACSLLLVFLLSGCTGVSSINLKSDTELKQIKAQEGVLVFSMTLSGAEHVFLRTRSLDGEVDGGYRFQLTAEGTEFDWHNPESRLLVVNAPAKDYEFYRWLYTTIRGLSSETVSNVEHFSIRYKVEPGTITYIGNININIKGGSYDISVRDYRKRDLDLLNERYTRFGNEKITIDLAEKQDNLGVSRPPAGKVDKSINQCILQMCNKL